MLEQVSVTCRLDSRSAELRVVEAGNAVATELTPVECRRLATDLLALAYGLDGQPCELRVAVYRRQDSQGLKQSALVQSSLGPVTEPTWWERFLGWWRARA